MKRVMIAGAFALAGWLGGHAASITLTASPSGDLTIAQALANAGSSIAALTGNDVDDIIVAGSGRIVFDTDIRGYLGAVHVSSGATAVLTTNYGLGATSGVVYVADGGALVSDGTGHDANAFTFTKAAVHVSGTGPDNAGALVGISGSNTQRKGIWGGTIVLDGDTLLSTSAGKYIDFPKDKASASVTNLHMNGHTLTLSPKSLLPLRMSIGTPGHIVVTNRDVSINDDNYLNGDASNTLTVGNNGRVSLFSSVTRNRKKWTFVGDAKKANWYSAFQTENGGGVWDGPVSVLKALTLGGAISESGGVYKASPTYLYGPIGGAAPLTLMSSSPDVDCQVDYYFQSPNNSFSGGVTVSQHTCLHVMADGAVPAAGDPVVVSNGVLDVQAYPCTLPDMDCFYSVDGAGVTGNALGASVAGTFTKRGPAKLTCQIPLTAGSIDLQAGALRFAAPAMPWYVGIYEGDNSTGNWSGTPGPNDPPKANSLFDGSVTYTNSVQCSLRWTTARYEFPGGAGCSTYDGWFYCPAAATWRFASSIVSVGKLFIDGSSVCGRQSSNAIFFGNISLSKGWHRIQYRIGRVNGYTSPNTSVTAASEKGKTDITADVGSATLTAWKNSGLGLAVCKDADKVAANTVDPADFAALATDPGDGSVFRLVKPGSDEETAMEAAYLARHELAALTAATNTTLDLGGESYGVTSVTGFPTVVHTEVPSWLSGETPNLTVRGSWVAPAEGIAAGGRFTVTGGSLTFAANTTVSVTGSGALSSGDGGIVIASATGGITGLPGVVFEGGVRRGTLRLSADGRSLVLVSSGTMLIVR